MIFLWYDCYCDELEQMVHYAALGYQRCLTVASGGNISMRCKDGILISASGTTFRALTPEEILLVNLKGELIGASGERQPSKEMWLHLEIYRTYPDAVGVYHVHPRYITAYSVNGIQFPRVTSSARRKLSPSTLVREAPAGSPELLDHLREAIVVAGDEKFPIFILRAHGIITMGGTLRAAYESAELAEESAKIALLSQIAALEGGL
ncbi:class II aldolase [Eubacteriales bacterium]|nr:class II aldolase [Eubacteriales bacterium]